MNTNIHKACKCYGLYDGNEIIGFYSILHFPHPTNKRIKKGHRLVILPDYQGIGLGSRFNEMVAQKYVDEGWDFRQTQSARNIVEHLDKSPLWQRTSKPRNRGNEIIRYGGLSLRDAVTSSFKYVGRQ